MTFLTCQSRKVTGQSIYLYIYKYTSVGWLVLGPSYFSQDVVLYGSFYRYCVQQYLSCGMRAKNKNETESHTHGQIATPVALDHRVDPTSDPTSQLVIYAVSGPGKQPS